MIKDKIIQLKNGRKLAYSEFGDPKGKPLFYFHGWPASCMFGAEIDEAAKHAKVRIISPDRPGFGHSDFYTNRTLLDWPNDVVALADSLNIKKFPILGISGGGPYAAACAYKIPERLTNVGIAVGLAPTNIPNAYSGISPLLGLGWRFYPYPFISLIASWIAITQYRYLPFLNSLRFPASGDQKLLNDGVNKRMNESMNESFRQGIKGPARDLYLYTTDWGFKVKDIKKPLYLWYGDDDKNVSLSMGKYYKNQVPGSTLTIYKGEGHFCRMNHYDEILKALI